MNHGLLYKNITFTSKIILMAQIELIMPKMGESITEATVLSWLKKPGDKIEQEESVLEVATDKVDTEIPSTHAGVLKEILVQKGEIVLVGKPIAILTVEAEESTPNENALPPERLPAADIPSVDASISKDIPAGRTNGKNHISSDYKSSSKFFSPLVKNIAKEE